MFKKHNGIIVRSAFVIILITALLPVLRFISPMAIVEGVTTYIAYLPISLFIALACVFGVQIIPALLIGIFCGFNIELDLTALQNAILTLAVIVPLWVSLAMLRVRLGERYRADIFDRREVFEYLIFLGILYPILMQASLYCAGLVTNMGDDFQYYFSIKEVILLLLNVQSLMLPAIIFTPIFYRILRMLTSLSYSRRFYFIHIVEAGKGTYRNKTLGWFSCLLILLLSYVLIPHSHVLSSYVIPAILLVFVYGFINLDSAIVGLLWPVVLYLIIQYDSQFVVLIKKNTLLICFSALFIVFSISNTWLSTMRRRLTNIIHKLYNAMRRDPLTRLPNLLALADELKPGAEGLCLCYVKLFTVDKIEKHLGVSFKANVKISLYSQLKRLLGDDVKIFSTPNSDLLMLLPENNIRTHLFQIRTNINHVKLTGRTKNFDVTYGFSWVNSNQIGDIYQTICGLEYLATIKGENKITALHEHDDLVEKYTTLDIQKLDEVKYAIAEEGIRIYTQKIKGIAQECEYYEVLCRLEYNDKLITPDVFLPLISEFNLCSLFDFSVIKAFLEVYSSTLPQRTDIKYSINIMPETLGAESTAETVINLFDSFSVDARSFIFEVTEEQFFFNKGVVINNINKLREAGFLIAIDDFGKGYANYERLKTLDADVLKIDGMFIRDIVNNKVDYIIVKSIIEIAQMKGMKTVAEFVETREHLNILSELNIDYVQGYFIGKPEPLLCQVQ